METRFEADVRQILHLVTHSLYSDREIFLRELVSNASDALDRARFEALQDKALRPVDGEPGIRISVDADKKTITVSDDGIGLTKEQAQEHLGRIAHSGTKAFAEALKAAGKEADGLIGKFGVGFYSAFMVADKVTVESLSADPSAEPVLWTSDGGETYTLEPGKRDKRGTDVVLHLREDAAEFLDPARLKGIVRKHSEFVQWPVFVGADKSNTEQALWTKNPSDIADEEYTNFYRHISGDWDEPLLKLHVQADAPLQFQAVLFIPKNRPWQLDRLDYKTGLKLYQRRVKVLDSADALLPRFLRFVRGVVDSPDVDLNVSREILQQTPVVKEINKQLTKRVLKHLKKTATAEADTYATLWKEFGHILKEGLAEGGPEHKDALTELLRFKTTRSGEELRSLAQVKAGFDKGQDALWYITSVDKERIAKAPALETFKKRGWEVLLMDDPVDEWVAMSVHDFEGVELKNVMTGEVPQDAAVEEDPIAKAAKEQATPLAQWMGTLLGADVAEVRLSTRLTESPSVLVDQEGGMGSNLERILQAANQQVSGSKRVLELNPEHPMVKTLARLKESGKEAELEPFARLLLDHAAIAEGRLEDPDGFARRLQVLMERASASL